jgi:galactonate dehydratase
VETDAGVHGWGEGTTWWQDANVRQTVHALEDRLVGLDPAPIEHVWRLMYDLNPWRGSVAHNSAVSAIDHALWDIKGKALGVPVYSLLGGPLRDRLRAYTHASEPEQATRLVSQGFNALKTAGWTYVEGVEEKEVIARLEERLSSLRAAVGPDVDLLIDNAGRSRPSVAAKQLRVAERFSVVFFEEPVPTDNLDVMAQLRRQDFGVDFAAGERLFTRWGFKDLIERRLVDVVQPDISHAGGISELRRIAAMAETYQILVAPHNSSGPIATAASVHLCAAIPNFLIQEYAMAQPMFDDVQLEPLKPVDGYFPLPTAPGLGVELDEEFIASRMSEQ